MGLWTRVRLPSTPLKSKASNTYPKAKFGVFRTVFGIIIDLTQFDDADDDEKRYALSFRGIRRWISDNYGLDVSNSSVTMVKDKCGIDKLEVNAKAKCIPELKTEKEKVVLEAFKHFNVV